jgi:hypothetical protein
MKEVTLGDAERRSEAGTFAACVATILELPLAAVPSQGPATSWEISRWLGGMGLGLAPIADAASFSWAGIVVTCEPTSSTAGRCPSATG